MHSPSDLSSTQLRALYAASKRPISTRGQAGRFKLETLNSLACLGLVTLSGQALATVAAITPAGRAALAQIEVKRRKPRVRRLAPVVLVAALLACGVDGAPAPVDASADAGRSSAGSPVPRRPCVPTQPDTCLLGRCVDDGAGFACVGTPWPQVCKWHSCTVGELETCERRPGTSGGQCIAVEGPTRGCCLYPQPAGGSQW